MAQQATPFGLKRPEITAAEAKRFVAEILDPQIDELQDQLALMHAHRRALAASFGIDRRPDAGRMGQMIDAANRQQYEGGDEESRLVPRGKPEAA